MLDGPVVFHGLFWGPTCSSFSIIVFVWVWFDDGIQVLTKGTNRIITQTGNQTQDLKDFTFMLYLWALSCCYTAPSTYTLCLLNGHTMWYLFVLYDFKSKILVVLYYFFLTSDSKPCTIAATFSQSSLWRKQVRPSFESGKNSSSYSPVQIGHASPQLSSIDPALKTPVAQKNPSRPCWHPSFKQKQRRTDRKSSDCSFLKL